MPNPIALPPHNKGPDFGRQIFVYNHLQTNQVVYSLTPNLNVCPYLLKWVLEAISVLVLQFDVVLIAAIIGIPY